MRGWGSSSRRHGARYLVTRTNRDDQVETDSAAPPERERAGRSGRHPRARARRLVRPLLRFAKARLVAHVAELGLAVHEDPANHDPRHLRSWVRTALLPLVAERLGARAGEDVLRAGRAAARERPRLGRRPRSPARSRTGASSRTTSKLPEGDWPAMMTACPRCCCGPRRGVPALVLGVRRARQLVELARARRGGGCRSRQPAGAGSGVQATRNSPNTALPRSPWTDLHRSVGGQPRVARSRSDATSAVQPSASDSRRPDGRRANSTS